MSKKAVSIAAIWLLMSMLVRVAAQPFPEDPGILASPAAQKLNVELLGHWQAANVIDLEVHGDRAFMANYYGSSPVVGNVSVVDVAISSNPQEVVPKQRIDASYDDIVWATSADDSHIYLVTDGADGGNPPRSCHRW